MLSVAALITSVLIAQAPGARLPSQPNVVLASKMYQAGLPSGDTDVRLDIVEARSEGKFLRTWSFSKEFSDSKLPEAVADVPVKDGVRTVALVYRVPVGSGTVMCRCIHDPDLEETGVKVAFEQGPFYQSFCEAFQVPPEWKKMSFRLGVPYGELMTLGTFPVKPGEAPPKGASSVRAAKNGKGVIASVDLDKDPSIFEFIGFAMTEDGKLHGGEVASWVMDDYGRLTVANPQDFSFAGLKPDEVRALVVKVRKIAYVEFKDVPLK